MTRLASTAKAGFYPTPDRVTELITRFVVPVATAEPHQGRLLDPCAGEGIAAETVARAWHLDGYGIEIDAERALAASSRLTRVLHLDYAQARTPLHAFQVLYANPPYDIDTGEGKRLEYTCLRDTTKWLCAGGLLVYLVPQYRVDARMAGFLAASFKDLRAYKFPDPEYQTFKQVVIFGIAKNEPGRDDTAALALLSACRGALLVLSDEPSAEERYTLPAALPEDSKRAFYFRGNELNPQEALDEALKRGVWASDEWRDQIEPHRAFDSFRPLMPLKKGHLATLIAAGMLQNILLENDHGERVLVKGRTYKVQEEVETAEEDEAEVVRDRFVTEIIALDLNTGEHTQINDPSALAEFIERWREVLVAQVQETFKPLYEFDLDAEGPRVNATLNGLSKNRRLPERAETGLFPAQKHVSVALWKRLQTADSAICVGEMGTGKAQPVDAKVLTPHGWKFMGQIAIGEMVIAANGMPTRVVGVFPQGEKEIYRVTFTDGSSTECCDEHFWQVNTPLRKWKGRPARVLPLNEIRRSLAHRNGNLQHFIPMVQPVQFEEKKLPLDPYLLGALLGDGGLSQKNAVQFTTADAEMVEFIEAALPEGITLKRLAQYGYGVTNGRRGVPNPVLTALRAMGLLGHRAESKFVPDLYLLGSVNTRLAVLQGLMDTDGYVSRGNNDLELTTVSQVLADDMRFLVQSLGGVATITTRRSSYTYGGVKREGQLAYRLYISLPNGMQPFRLKRKLECYHPRTKYHPTRAIRSVEFVGRKAAQCIKVEADDGLYVTDDFIVTHNTTIAITVSELMRACTNDTRPSLVLCPPHLIAKWIREIQETAPGAFAMELRRIGDVPDFMRRVKTLTPGTPAYAVVSREMAKLGSGWKPAYIKRRLVLREEVRVRDEGDGWGSHDEVRWTSEEVLACPNCGHPVCEVEGGREYGHVHDPAYLAKRKRFCFACHAPLFQMTHLNGATRACASSFPLLGSNGNGNGNSRAKVSVTERYPIADYIARRYPGFFKLLIADEVHQAKGQSTDQGYAFGALARCCAKTLALTGTIYGGRATSLFFLLYRLLPQVRAEFKWTDAQRWAERYGILERVTKRDQGDEGNGVYSAKRRSKTYVRELPGASPELAARLLDGAAFVTLADLGFPLPEYAEFAEEVAMSERQAETYAKLDEELSDELQDRLARGDQSLLGAYLQSLLGRPAASFRDEVVMDKYGEVVATAPAIDEPMFPKEKWLVDLCQQERKRGRKVLVYCRQTATRDITPRLVSLLDAAHLRADTLKANIEASKREAWLHKRMSQGMLDVLITNPKLVETGLDLVAFQTVVWFETDYSLYTVMQAARRTWRLGQTQPVAVWYAVYVNTMEHRAAALIGQKLAAAKLLYGDAVEGALIQNADVGRGLLTELARNAIAGTQVTDLHAYFKRAALATPNEKRHDGDGHAKSGSTEQGESAHPRIPVFVPVMPLALPLSPVKTGDGNNGNGNPGTCGPDQGRCGNGHAQPEHVRGVAIPMPLGFPVDTREAQEGATETIPVPLVATKKARQLVLF